MLKVMVKIG